MYLLSECVGVDVDDDDVERVESREGDGDGEGEGEGEGNSSHLQHGVPPVNVNVTRCPFLHPHMAWHGMAW